MSSSITESSPAPPWYSAGLRFGCTQCGHCCGGGPGYVWIAPAEIAALAAHLGQTVEEFTDRHTRKVGWRRALLEQRNWDCEFLVSDGNGRKVCSVYEVRPVQCRTWPFWKSNLESQVAWRAAGEGCPGIERGRRHALPVIQAALNANGTLPL